MPPDSPRPHGASRRAAVARAFGERVRGSRIEAGLSEGELAARCGVAHSTINKLELGRSEPRISLALALCEGLGVSPDVLMGDLLAASAESRVLASRLRARLALLTPREREVFEGLSRAESNGEIAYELRIGVETVRTHVARVRAKLEVGSRRELIGMASLLQDQAE